MGYDIPRSQQLIWQDNVITNNNDDQNYKKKDQVVTKLRFNNLGFPLFDYRLCI